MSLSVAISHVRNKLKGDESMEEADKCEAYEFTDNDKKIMDHMMAKALLKAQVRKGLLAEESFNRMAQKIDLKIEKLSEKC